MNRISNKGNVHDVKCCLDLAFPRLTIDELKDELEYEKQHRNRVSVIQLMERAIRKKEKEASNGQA
jgi:hypothetical protein